MYSPSQQLLPSMARGMAAVLFREKERSDSWLFSSRSRVQLLLPAQLLYHKVTHRTYHQLIVENSHAYQRYQTPRHISPHQERVIDPMPQITFYPCKNIERQPLVRNLERNTNEGLEVYFSIASTWISFPYPLEWVRISTHSRKIGLCVTPNPVPARRNRWCEMQRRKQLPKRGVRRFLA